MRKALSRRSLALTGLLLILLAIFGWNPFIHYPDADAVVPVELRAPEGLLTNEDVGLFAQLRLVKQPFWKLGG